MEASVVQWEGWWFCIVSDDVVRSVSMFQDSRESAVDDAAEKAGVELVEVGTSGEFIEELLRYLTHGEPISSEAKPPGTELQREVYDVVSDIPFGETMSYGEVAEAVDSSSSARAVGSALNANPAPLFVPCHRVVSKNGLGGFSGGLKTKKFLLGLENQKGLSH